MADVRDLTLNGGSRSVLVFSNQQSGRAIDAQNTRRNCPDLRRLLAGSPQALARAACHHPFGGRVPETFIVSPRRHRRLSRGRLWRAGRQFRPVRPLDARNLDEGETVAKVHPLTATYFMIYSLSVRT